MTFKYNNVYINEAATIVGPYEFNGPLSKYYDKHYKEFYFGKKTWEEAEVHILKESVELLLKKSKKEINNIDLFISGDLMNQITSSSFTASYLHIPYLGIFSACASSVEGLIIGSNMIENNQIKNCICSVSSHNNAAEKQFRYPVEYGGPKPKTTTFTVTGGASVLISSEKSKIKIESATIGTVQDKGIKNVFAMGAVMAPAFADTLYRHLKDMNRDISYYDLILSGDLGKYGKDIVKEYMKKAYNINLINYDDTACMIYDLDKQPVYSGGSGPACAPLVTYAYIFRLMKERRLKKVLLIATGSLHSTTTVNEKRTIPSIAHAISLEATI